MNQSRRARTLAAITTLTLSGSLVGAAAQASAAPITTTHASASQAPALQVASAPKAVRNLFDPVCGYHTVQGQQNGCVTRLQNLLNTKEHAGLVVDGIFGSKTLAAVKRWQGNHDLVQDGKVGPKTKRSLGDRPPSRNAKAVDIAYHLMYSTHIPYVWGGGHGSTPGPTKGGLDCSGFARWVYAKAFGYDRLGAGTAAHMYTLGTKTTNPEPGDLVFFKRSSGHIYHVGVYIGNNKMINELTPGHVIEWDHVSAMGAPHVYAHYSG